MTTRTAWILTARPPGFETYCKFSVKSSSSTVERLKARSESQDCEVAAVSTVTAQACKHRVSVVQPVWHQHMTNLWDTEQEACHLKISPRWRRGGDITAAPHSSSSTRRLRERRASAAPLMIHCQSRSAALQLGCNFTDRSCWPSKPSQQANRGRFKEEVHSSAACLHIQKQRPDGQQPVWMEVHQYKNSEHYDPWQAERIKTTVQPSLLQLDNIVNTKRRLRIMASCN